MKSTFSLRGFFAATAAIALTTFVSAAPTVYIAGDSTVQTYRASQAPQQGWGGRIAEYFTTDLIFSNRAIAGRSSKSFVVDGRLDTILSLIKPGDYLFVQFGANDASSIPERHTDPQTTYKQYLSMYIDGARAHGAIPVLVTVTPRRSFDSAGNFKSDFAAYVTAMKELAVAKNVTLIDLTSRGIAYLNSIGAEASKKVFLYVPAGQFTAFPNGAMDNTHFQEFGASQMARLVTEGVKASGLSIASFIKGNVVTGKTFQAESAVISGTGTAQESVNPGFHGTGYVNFATSGGAVTFNGITGTGGQKVITIRYALGITTARTGNIVVNGAAKAIAFQPSGSWTTWNTQTVTVTLNNNSTNTIQLASTGNDLANIDEITVP